MLQTIIDKFNRSWELAKISYGILWQNTSLILFPIVSSIVLILVTASYWAPLYGFGFFEHMHDQGESFYSPLNLIIIFLFYFLSYFIIFFFNSALTACAIKAVSGQEVTVADGFNVAIKRLPQIIGWALLSAVVGLLLKMLERQEKIAAIVAAIIGTAWSVITFFVVPVIVVEGFGPITAIKRSLFVLKSTWGEGLAGNLSMGFINFLLFLPCLLLCILMVVLAVSLNSGILFFLAFGASAIIFSLYFAATSAAEVIFRAVLFNYATGAQLPAGMDKSTLDGAFVPK